MIRLNDMEFQYFVQFIGKQYGINLEKKRILIECRLAKELERYHLSDFGDYIRLLEQDKDGKIQGEMLNRLTTNYTYFAREPEHFKYIWNEILPKWAKKNLSLPFRVWCAGCSTGEECYTLAMLFEDYRKQVPAFSYSITGSDISGEVLDEAKRAVYSMREYESVPENWRENYCEIIDDKYFRLSPWLKEKVSYRRENLLKPSAGRQRYDLVMCRNVMIYFSQESRSKLLEYLEKSLNPGGYLMVGHSELISGRETTMESVHTAVYRKACRREEDKNG